MAYDAIARSICRRRISSASGSSHRAITDREAYPFCLPLLRDDFELSFDRAITIIVGENGTGKSTLLEGIAVLAGYDEAGGGKGYMPVDHSDALEKMGGQLSTALRASWLPKITNGWFFRAESFFSVARYLDELLGTQGPTAGLPLAFPWRRFSALLRGALPAAGHLHLRRTGIRTVALAPDRIPEADAADGEYRPLPDHHGHAFADADGLSGATLLRLTKYGLEPVTVKDTDHYKVMREFCEDPAGFVEAAIVE